MAALAGLDSMARLHWWPYLRPPAETAGWDVSVGGGIWSMVRQHDKPCSPFPGADSGVLCVELHPSPRG